MSAALLLGTIVRCIVRLDETCRDVRNAARVIGDPVLYKVLFMIRYGFLSYECFLASEQRPVGLGSLSLVQPLHIMLTGRLVHLGRASTY